MTPHSIHMPPCRRSIFYVRVVVRMLKADTLFRLRVCSQYRRRKQIISNLPEAASAKRQMQQVAISWDPKKNTPLLGGTILRLQCFIVLYVLVPSLGVCRVPK